jgi:hypothetical protein
MFAGRPLHPFQANSPDAMIPIRRIDLAGELNDVLRGRSAQRIPTSRCWITNSVKDQHGERPKTPSVEVEQGTASENLE